MVILKVVGCKKQSAAAAVGKANALNLIGQTFDSLQVIEKTEQRRGTEIMWKCKCVCGNETLVSTSDLTKQKVHSCGCMRFISQGGLKIKNILIENKIKFLEEYSPTDLKSNKNGFMRFDFALIKNNQIYRLIEYDGEQHFGEKDANYWYDTYENIHDRDLRKNDWAKNKNIPLVRIPYWEKENINLEMILGNQFII